MFLLKEKKEWGEPAKVDGVSDNSRTDSSFLKPLSVYLSPLHYIIIHVHLVDQTGRETSPKQKPQQKCRQAYLKLSEKNMKINLVWAVAKC